MKYRRKDTVMRTGKISYLIQVRRFFFWFRYNSFATRRERDAYFDLLIFSNL